MYPILLASCRESVTGQDLAIFSHSSRYTNILPDICDPGLQLWRPAYKVIGCTRRIRLWEDVPTGVASEFLFMVALLSLMCLSLGNRGVAVANLGSV